MGARGHRRAEPAGAEGGGDDEPAGAAVRRRERGPRGSVCSTVEGPCVGRADEFASSLATLSKEMFAPAVEVARAALALDIWPRFEETDDWRRIAATL